MNDALEVDFNRFLIIIIISLLLVFNNKTELNSMSETESTNSMAMLQSYYSRGAIEHSLAAGFVSSRNAPPFLGKECCVTRQNSSVGD